MRLQGDQLIYDKAGNRVIARGNVEIYYNNYILTADEVVYDQGAGTLTAVGNVTVKEPQGNIVHADRYTLTDDFRDGFVQSLSIVSQDQSRSPPSAPSGADGNVNEFENGKFTPCKSDGDTPPLWCISAARIIHDADAATHHLSGRVFRNLRAAGFLPALLPDARPVGEAEVRLPDAGLRPLVDARLHHRHTLLLRACSERRHHGHARHT